jgi:transposase
LGPTCVLLNPNGCLGPEPEPTRMGWKMMPQEPAYVAVDVSKATLEIGEPELDRTWSLSNGPKGWGKLIAWIERFGRPVVVGLEPSGGYERGLVEALLEAGIDVRWCDPARVRALAKALGAPAKTDRIDVGMIRRFLAQTGGRPVRRDRERDALRASLSARRAAQEAAQALEAQAQALPEGPARQALAALAAQARLTMKAQERAAIALVRASQALSSTWRRLQTAPGVGPLVAAELLAHMPELGAVSSKAIAKLAGLAPFIRRSGQWQGRAVCSGGRPRPRQLLYLAVITCLRGSSPTKATYQHLVAAGKPPKLAITACMRRLLVTLNAMIRDQADWRPA